MAKDPAFLFYPNDWIGGTMGMTFEQKGVYMELLMLQFNRGHMTSHMIGQAVGQKWDEVKDKFKKDEHGKWYNERLESEKTKRKSYVVSRVNNKKGNNQYTKNVGHMTSHMENENENTNKLWFIKYYKANYEFYKSNFNGQSTTEEMFNEWKLLVDFIYEKRWEKLFECKFLTPHSFSELVSKEKFTKDLWQPVLKKILSTGIKPEHDLFFRIPQFMEYNKTKSHGTGNESTTGKHITRFNAGANELLNRGKAKINEIRGRNPES